MIIFKFSFVTNNAWWSCERTITLITSFIASTHYIPLSVEGAIFSVQGKLLPDDGASTDHFGAAVTLYNTNVMVGSYNDDDRGTDSGIKYLMRMVFTNLIIL
jgi:hypothetical protein